jgi:hypothetical protein
VSPSESSRTNRFAPSRTLAAADVPRENVGSRTSTGLSAGVVVGPLLAILAAGVAFFIFFLRRRKGRDVVSGSPEGHELSYETDRNDNSLSFEEELSAASEYANFSEFEARMDDEAAGFEQGNGLEEGLFGF